MSETLLVKNRPIPSGRDVSLHPFKRQKTKMHPVDAQAQHALAGISNAIQAIKLFMGLSHIDGEDRKVMRECLEDLQDIREDIKEVWCSVRIDRDIDELDK